MVTKNFITLFRSESLTESVLIHAHSLGVSLAKESVKERRGDPGLEYLPSTDVGTSHGATI